MQWSAAPAYSGQPDPNQGLKIKIVGDGTPWGTRVVDATTGAQMWGVESVIVQARPNEAPMAIIRVRNVQIDMQATVDRTQPATGEAIGYAEE